MAKMIHPKNVSNGDLINSLISNLRRDPSKDVSIITDELLSRLSPKPPGWQLDLLNKIADKVNLPAGTDLEGILKILDEKF
jgi:hypothetical protein